VIINWEVDDGYAGASRPQSTEIDDDDLADCETDKEREILIATTIQEDFGQSVSWYETGRDKQ